MSDNLKLNFSSTEESYDKKGNKPVTFNVDSNTVFPVIQEICEDDENCKIFLKGEDFSVQIPLSKLTNEAICADKKIDQIIVEKFTDGSIKIFEFNIGKSVGKRSLKVVKPIEEVHPLINRQYLSIQRSEKIIKIGSFYRNIIADDHIHEFAFTSTSEYSAHNVVTTVLQVGLFFCYHENLKVNLIVNSESIEKLREVFKDLRKETIKLSNKEVSTLNVENINIINIDEIAEIAKHFRRKNIFQTFYNQANHLTLWEIPTVKTLEEEKFKYFPILEVIENITIISNRGKNKSHCIRETMNYFKNMNIQVLGNIWGQNKK
jgi:hypothetical protein